MTLLGPLGVALAVFMAALVGVLLVDRIGARSDAAAQKDLDRVPFAGGTPPHVHAWSRYHARYYVMALVFLAFDMEMVYMYPWAVVFLQEGAIAMIEMAMFITILLLGLLYAWRERALAWS